MDLQHIDGTLDECWRPFHGVRQQEPPKAPRRDEMLSPLPLQGMQQLFPFQDTVIPPTPPLPEPSLPPAPSTYHAYSSLTAAQAMSPTSPSIPYFSTPTYFNVPYGQSTAYLVSPPSQCLPSYEGSPGGASVSSHRSLGQISSPGQASVYYSLPPSPATRASSVYYTPMQAAPSTLPDISGASQTLPSSGTSSTPTRLRRVRIKQTIPYSSEWRDTAKETFTTGGIPGVPVLAVLQDCTALDRHEEITALKITKVRLIRLVIAVSRHIRVEARFPHQTDTFTLLQWPGYGEDRHYITVKKGEVCMTRGELARAICSQISTFMTRAAVSCSYLIRRVFQTLILLVFDLQKQHLRPKYAQWAIGKHGITIDQLWLVSLAKAQTGVWLAGLEVLP
ncbi:hypothetical protein TRAPUB_7551 [Trametes pubescens]|uniref:Uncharacterized protein n=1 Tax=Trametes pubescens TaxID=154538 RepID=A0A1M2V393_TRAPU|nr:hypothetical protein TRAPUB_7551 [Trametes pubescens]